MHKVLERSILWHKVPDAGLEAASVGVQASCVLPGCRDARCLRWHRLTSYQATNRLLRLAMSLKSDGFGSPARESVIATGPLEYVIETERRSEPGT
jgi:hypothetical protein